MRPRADAAVASAAARASEPPPQRLPDFARAMERKQERQQKELQYQTGPAQAEAPKPVRTGAKIGRNDPCPCGSGLKYKKCHASPGGPPAGKAASAVPNLQHVLEHSIRTAR